MEEFDSLAAAGAASKHIGGGVEVALLRDYVEEMEIRQLKIVKESQELKAENEQRAKDQADVYYYLNKKLDDNYDVINNLEEQIIREQSEREISEKEYEQTIDQVQAKLAAEEARFKSRLLELEDKLDAVRDFMGRKEEMESELQRTNDLLATERAAFREKFEILDKNRIQEKQQIRQEFEIELAAVKRHHKADIDSKLSAKAKKSLMLNTMYKKELKYQTLQAEEVLVHDKLVAEQDRARRTEMDLSKGMELELQNKLVEYQRTIKALNKRLDEDKGKFSDTCAQDELEKRYEEKCAEYDSLLADFNNLKNESAEDRDRHGKIWAVLMNHYYDRQKRGVRKPLNKIEIEANPERFVVELLFGAFEANPSRFKKAVRRQMGGGAGGSSGGGSFFADGQPPQEEELHDDSLTLLPDDQKWWSTQNSAYVTSSNSPDFAVMKTNYNSNTNGFSVPSSRTSRGVYSSKSAEGPKIKTSKNISTQTDEALFSVANPVSGDSIEDAVSIASSNFVIDSYSVPNLQSGGSGFLSSTGGSRFLDNFSGASVDRGIGGNMLRRNVNNRSYDAANFTRKKKVAKKIILPRMDHMSKSSTPQTDFAISGQPISCIK